MIVVASNYNKSSQVTLTGFSICVPVPVIQGLTRFLTIAEVTEVEDTRYRLKEKGKEGGGNSRMRSENDKIVEEGIKKLRRETW